MARCDYCKSAELIGNTCPNCGRILCNFEECHIISGTNAAFELARITVTDKYMMLYVRGAGKTFAAASFGLLGALAAEALSSGNRYGFYDLKEIEKVIYPYINSKFKKDTALKIVNKDGSDMIIRQVIGAVKMDKIAACFKAAGVFVDSSRTDYGKVFCLKPFVDKKTMASRICPSAASFVKPVKGNFLAASVSGQVASAPAPAPAATVKPEQPTVTYTPPVETKAEEKPAPAPAPAPNVTIEQLTPAPVYEAPTQSAAPAFKFCFKCGNKIPAEDIFCGKCGTKQ